MTSPFDTEHWQLRILADFHLVNVSYERCTECSGSGEVGGGFKSIDGPTTCNHCNGSGSRQVDVEPKPSMPEGLTEHMRKAYKEFISLHEKRKNAVSDFVKQYFEKQKFMETMKEKYDDLIKSTEPTHTFLYSSGPASWNNPCWIIEGVSESGGLIIGYYNGYDEIDYREIEKEELTPMK